MTIEAQLQELIDINKAILTAIQSGAQVSAAAGEQATSATTRTRRTKAEIEADKAAEAAKTAVVDGDPAGTAYWHNEAQAVVFTQKPGEAAPAADAGFLQVTAQVYLAAKAAYEKAEAAKNAQAAATQQAAASTEPSATAQQVTASAATSANAEATWDEAVAALKALATNPAHGSAAVLKVVKQIDPAAANVPALKDKGKNAEILAAVNALLNPAAAGAEVDPLFG